MNFDTIMDGSKSGEDNKINDEIDNFMINDEHQDDQDIELSTNSDNNNNNNNNSTSEGSAEQRGCTIVDALRPNYMHWIQTRWTTPYDAGKMKYIIGSPILLEPEYLFPFVAIMRWCYDNVETRGGVELTANRNPELFENRCAEFFESTQYALYDKSPGEDYIGIITPIDNNRYYQNLLLREVPVEHIQNILKMKSVLLGKYMEPINSAQHIFDEYKPPHIIDITGDNDKDEKESGIYNIYQNNDNGNTNNDSSTRARNLINSNNINSRINKDSNFLDLSTRAQQRNLRNVLINERALGSHTGNVDVGVTPINTGGGNAGNVDPKLKTLQDFITRMTQNINEAQTLMTNMRQGNNVNDPRLGALGAGVLGTNNNNGINNNTNNTQAFNNTEKELDKLIGKEMFEQTSKIDITYNMSDKMPGNLLHFKNRIKMWYENCKNIFKERINDEKVQIVLCKALTKTLTSNTLNVFTRKQLTQQNVAKWHERFDEITSVEDDFKRHFELLKNYVPPRNTTIEKYILTFKDAKAVHDMILPTIIANGKISNMQYYQLRDDRDIYEALISNMNPKIISDVTKYMIDNYNSIDWSYIQGERPDFQPSPNVLIDNIDILHTGIINLAAYIRKIRTSDAANTKYDNQSILEYHITNRKPKPDRYGNDNTTHIGNQVNAIFGKQYDKQKFKPGFRRLKPYETSRLGYQNPRQWQKKQRGYHNKNKYGRGNNRNNNNYIEKYRNKGNKNNRGNGLNIPGFIRIQSKYGELYKIEKNSKAQRYFKKLPLIKFKRKSVCKICPKDSNDRFGHSTRWHNYLYNMRPGAIAKLRDIYFDKYVNNKNQNNAMVDNRGRSDKKHRGQGRSNKQQNKQNSGKTNTAGTIAIQDDTLHQGRGGIILEQNDTTQQVQASTLDEHINKISEANTNILNNLETAKVSNAGMLLSFTTQSKREGSKNPNL